MCIGMKTPGLPNTESPRRSISVYWSYSRIAKGVGEVGVFFSYVLCRLIGRAYCTATASDVATSTCYPLTVAVVRVTDK
jgi:hypothetical protein